MVSFVKIVYAFKRAASVYWLNVTEQSKWGRSHPVLVCSTTRENRFPNSWESWAEQLNLGDISLVPDDPLLYTGLLCAQLPRTGFVLGPKRCPVPRAVDSDPNGSTFNFSSGSGSGKINLKKGLEIVHNCDFIKISKTNSFKTGSRSPIVVAEFLFFTNLKSHHSFGKPEPDRVIKKQSESDPLKMNVDPPSPVFPRQSK